MGRKTSHLGQFFEFTEEELWSIYKQFDRYQEGGREEHIEYACKKLRVPFRKYRMMFSKYYTSYMEARYGRN